MRVDNNFIAKNKVKTLSFSFASNSKFTSIKHNERKPEDEAKLKAYGGHIHWNKTGQNEILVSKNIRRVYKDVFGQAVDEYNKKQRRKDRRIKNYYKKVKEDGNLETQKEFIIQVGKTGQQLSDDPEENIRLQKQVLKDFLNEFQETYPQLHVYSAVIHVDEKNPHMHLCVVPEAHGYKRGVKVQPAFGKAIGISDSQGFKEFCEDNRAILKHATEKALDVKVNREKVGTHTYAMPQDVRNMVNEAETMKKEAAQTLAQAQKEATQIVNKATEQVKTKYKTKIEIEEASKAVEVREKAVKVREDDLQDGLRDLQVKQVKNNAKYTELAQKEFDLTSKQINLTDKENELNDKEIELNDKEQKINALMDKLNATLFDTISQMQKYGAYFAKQVVEKTKKLKDKIFKPTSTDEKPEVKDDVDVTKEAKDFILDFDGLTKQDKDLKR